MADGKILQRYQPYSPTTPADYPGVAPTLNQEALDAVAALANYANANQVYVDANSGSDVTGTGAQLRPFQSIPAALAAIALLGPGNYALNLAAGDYAGAPIAWPGNVSCFGFGQVNIQHDINYASGAGTEVLVFDNVSLGIVTADLTLGGISLMYISNGGLGSLTRTDATVGAKFVQVYNMNVNAWDITGNVFMYSCSFLSGGPYVVQSGSRLICNNSLVPAPITLNLTGVLALNACTTDVGCVVTGVGAGAQVVTDASSLYGGLSVAGTASFVFMDNASREAYTPTTIANWTPIPSTVQGALDILGSNIQGNAVIFKPGGVAGKNLYTTWPDVMTAVALLKGPTTIYFDDSNVTPAVIPAGVYALDNVTFDNWKQGQSTNVQVAAGVTWTGLVAINNLNIEFLNTAVVESLTQRAMFFEGTTITASGTAPIWEIPLGAQFQCYKGTFLNGTPASPVVDVLAGQTFILVLGTTSATNTVDDIAGTLTSSLLVFKDASGVFSTQASFAGTQSQTLVDNAASVAYSPGQPILWSTVPTQVKEALDTLVEDLILARNEFVYQPGGVQQGNVYTSWADLIQNMGYVQGVKTLVIDTSFAAAVVPAGAYDMIGVTFVARDYGTILEWGAGSSISTNFAGIRGGLIMRSTDPALNIWQVAGFETITIDESSELQASLTPFIGVQAGGTLNVMLSRKAALSTAGGAAPITVDAAGAANIYSFSDSLIGVGTVVGAGPVTYLRDGKPYREVGTISGPQAAAKAIDLARLIQSETAIFTIQGLSGLTYSFDYTLTDGVSFTTIDWTGLGLDGVIVGGENYSVQYRA